MIEETILNHIVTNDEFCRKVLPFLKEEYFVTPSNKILFNVVKNFIDAYNSVPNKVTLMLEVDKLSVNEDQYKEVIETIDKIQDDPKVDQQWLVDQTEKYCQDRAIFNAIRESITIIDGGNKDKKDKGAIPQILTDALSVSFDTSIGHDFLENAEDRYEFYHKAESKLEFDLEMFNKITRGGIPKKSLNVILAGTGVGKTLFMTHCAAGHLSLGKNVLYITMEMAEERIAERIDANRLNLTMDELHELPKESYLKKIENLKKKTNGRLIVKEYPTSAAGAGHFRHLINELKIKKNFLPDVIYIDYINICMSMRLKLGSSINTYSYIKAIAEEIRGLAVEYNVPIFTATQTNRDGYSNSDPGLENTSESFGLPATADMMFALVSNEDMEAIGQMMVIQLKNRYNDVNKDKRFVIGIERAKMKLYDVESHAQDQVMSEPKYKGKKNDTPVMDNSSFGTEDKFMSRGVAKRDFAGLKLK